MKESKNSPLALFSRVTSRSDLSAMAALLDPNPFEVEGWERVFRFRNAFRAAGSLGPAGLVKQALIWAHAKQLEDAEFQQFREGTGFNQPEDFVGRREEMLDRMADRIASLYDLLGTNLDVWSVVLLASRPQVGGTAGLLADVAKCGANASATDILDCIAAEADRRESEHRSE